MRLGALLCRSRGAKRQSRDCGLDTWCGCRHSRGFVVYVFVPIRVTKSSLARCMCENLGERARFPQCPMCGDRPETDLDTHTLALSCSISGGRGPDASQDPLYTSSQEAELDSSAHDSPGNGPRSPGATGMPATLCIAL